MAEPDYALIQAGARIAELETALTLQDRAIRSLALGLTAMRNGPELTLRNYDETMQAARAAIDAARVNPLTGEIRQECAPAKEQGEEG